MKAIRTLVALVVTKMTALAVIGAVILLIAAAWQFLTGGAQ